MKILIIPVLAFFSVMMMPLSADERADIYKELSVLKKDYRQRISEIRKADNDELKAEQKKSYQAISAVG